MSNDLNERWLRVSKSPKNVKYEVLKAEKKYFIIMVLSIAIFKVILESKIF